MAAQGTHLAPEGDGSPLGGGFAATPHTSQDFGTHLGPQGDAAAYGDNATFALPLSQHLGTHLAPEAEPVEALLTTPIYAHADLTGSSEVTAARPLHTHAARGRFTASGSVKATSYHFGQVHLDATGDLAIGDPILNRSGGSTASVQANPFGLGTKMLAGSMARVVVHVLGEGVRVQPYTEHPNTRQDPGYLPAGLAALAARRLNTPEPDEVVPRPTITRQTWSSDAPISRPAPAPSEPMVDLGGFAFGPTGLMIPVTEEDVEAMVVPTHEGA